MSMIWTVQSIYANADNPSEGSKADAKLFDDPKEALFEYGERFKVGLPGEATSLMLYLWRKDPRPSGRVHTVVKHAHFWKDADGTHCNEFSGAVQV